MGLWDYNYAQSYIFPSARSPFINVSQMFLIRKIIVTGLNSGFLLLSPQAIFRNYWWSCCAWLTLTSLNQKILLHYLVTWLHLSCSFVVNIRSVKCSYSRIPCRPIVVTQELKFKLSANSWSILSEFREQLSRKRNVIATWNFITFLGTSNIYFVKRCALILPEATNNRLMLAQANMYL